MSDYIEKQTVIDIFKAFAQKGAFSLPDLIYAVDKYEAKDAVEQKHGKWIVKDVVTKTEYRPTTQYREITCSVCKNHVAWPTNYCPNCGADMRGGT